MSYWHKLKNGNTFAAYKVEIFLKENYE